MIKKADVVMVILLVTRKDYYNENDIQFITFICIETIKVNIYMMMNIIIIPTVIIISIFFFRFEGS